MPFNKNAEELNVIHCPDMKEGSQVTVTIDGMSEVKATVRDCSEHVPTGTFLAIPPHMFGINVNDSEHIEALIAHGETRHTKVVVQDVPDDDKQLLIDFFLKGKTEKEVKDA